MSRRRRVSAPLPWPLPEAERGTKGLSPPLRFGEGAEKRGSGTDAEEVSMRVAVTGATGFLGRYLVRQLVEAGHSLRCWYRPGSDRSGFGKVAEAVEWVPGQLGEAPATRELIQGADAVVHAAVQ